MRSMAVATLPTVFLLQACGAIPEKGTNGAEGAGGAREEEVTALMSPLGWELPPPSPRSGDPDGSWLGGDHARDPGSYHHSLCDDPQYAGLCDPHSPSGAAAPGNPQSTPGGGHGGTHHPAGPDPAEFASSLAKSYLLVLQHRGEDILKSYESKYKNKDEAARRACIGSCTEEFGALCGYVSGICTTGEANVPFSPGVITSCKAATDAACGDNPNACIASCFSNGAAAPAGHQSEDTSRAPPGVRLKWRNNCHFACKIAENTGCLTVSLSCTVGTTWTLGGAAVPCVYAVGAACLGSWTAGAACNKWCDM